MKKQCSGPCKTRKDAEKDFYKGRSSWCKECAKRLARAEGRADKRLREAHPKEHRKYFEEEMDDK